MTYPFYFKILLYDENKYYTQTGIGMGESFSDAAKQIEEYYESDLISILHLELCEDDHLILLPETVCKQYVNGDYSGLIRSDSEGNAI